MVFVVVRRGKRLATDKSAVESTLLSMLTYFDKKAQDRLDSPESEDEVFGKMAGLELKSVIGAVLQSPFYPGLYPYFSFSFSTFAFLFI